MTDYLLPGCHQNLTVIFIIVNSAYKFGRTASAVKQITTNYSPILFLFHQHGCFVLHLFYRKRFYAVQCPQLQTSSLGHYRKPLVLYWYLKSAPGLHKPCCHTLDQAEKIKLIIIIYKNDNGKLLYLITCKM